MNVVYLFWTFMKVNKRICITHLEITYNSLLFPVACSVDNSLCHFFNWANRFIMNIPLPWLLPVGFTIHVDCTKRTAHYRMNITSNKLDSITDHYYSHYLWMFPKLLDKQIIIRRKDKSRWNEIHHFSPELLLDIAFVSFQVSHHQILQQCPQNE